LLQRLKSYNIKINLEKCVFRSTIVNYPHRDRPYTSSGQTYLHKWANIKNTSLLGQKFINLKYFINDFCSNFYFYSFEKPPRATQKAMVGQEWPVGPGWSPLPYTFIIDTTLGDEEHPGGLGAILSQINSAGEHCVIA
jgi:hypothetical protein